MSSGNYSKDKLCLLSLASREGIGLQTLRKLMDGAAERDVPLAKLCQEPPSRLSRELGVRNAEASAVVAVSSPVREAERILKELRRMHARAVFEGDVDYPPLLSRALAKLAPPVLFVLGDARVLHRPCVGVSGSRTPSPAAQAAAGVFAAREAAAGVTVVSGGAAGVDTIAHSEALDAGATVFVPPVGLARFEWRGTALKELGDGRWCAVSHFPLDAGWKNAHALLRNRIIVALGEALTGFDPRDRGGTWHSCRTALLLGKPLFVVSGAAEPAARRGLKRLLRLGAQQLDSDHMPTAHEFQRLVREYRPPAKGLQAPLFGSSIERTDAEPPTHSR